MGSGARIVVIAVAAIVAVGVASALWIVTGPGPLAFAGGEKVALADYKGPDPTGVPASLKNAGIVARGQWLAKAADCTVCHTAKGGAEYAGGFAFTLPFGTIYSPNITPDKDTGIGNWTDAQFLNAVHKGIDDQGQHLYPAMPYASYTYLTDADALAIKAYLFSLRPVHNEVPDDKLAFPFNQRWLMGFWNMFFAADTRFKPDTAQSPAWNRGAYLAEGLAHCGECHTPRNRGLRARTTAANSQAKPMPAGAPTTSRATTKRASAPGRTMKCTTIFRPDTRSGTARPRARWAKRWIKASA